jgi:hypothetical protein
MNKIFLGILGLASAFSVHAGDPAQSSGNPIARAAASADHAVATRAAASVSAPNIGEAEFSALTDAGAFPVAGKNGITKRDVEILKRGAAMKVSQGSCARVEFGGKSTLNPGEYYVYCGNNRRLIFTEADLQ